MELILQQGLPHQQEAVDRLNQVFEGVGIFRTRNYFENHTIDLQDVRLRQNITAIQSNLPPDYRSFEAPECCLNLDIKKETGTGKTYVNTKTMFELHKNYGINKFNIAVPSIYIKK